MLGTATASDPDAGAIITYAFIPGGDAGGRFQIDTNTGIITAAGGASLDYEDIRTHVIVIRATDETGLTIDRGFIINVTNVNEAP